MQRVLEIIKGREAHKAVAALPGYLAANTGAVRTVKEFLERMDASRKANRCFRSPQLIPPGFGYTRETFPVPLAPTFLRKNKANEKRRGR